MKTIDEVIKAWEICHSETGDCDGCPYCDKCEGEMNDDVLHYLKEYHEMLNNAENDPLSWEELRMMQDKPVYWMHGEAGEWLTIYRVPTLGNGNDNVIYATTCSGVECWIWKKDLDKFQYYKKERK